MGRLRSAKRQCKGYNMREQEPSRMAFVAVRHFTVIRTRFCAAIWGFTGPSPEIKTGRTGLRVSHS